VDEQKTLSRTDRFEALQFAFASSDGQVGVLGAVVGSQALFMNARQPEVATRGPIRTQFVGHDPSRPYLVSLEQLSQ